MDDTGGNRSTQQPTNNSIDGRTGTTDLNTKRDGVDKQAHVGRWRTGFRQSWHDDRPTQRLWLSIRQSAGVKEWSQPRKYIVKKKNSVSGVPQDRQDCTPAKGLLGRWTPEESMKTLRQRGGTREMANRTNIYILFIYIYICVCDKENSKIKETKKYAKVFTKKQRRISLMI